MNLIRTWAVLVLLIQPLLFPPRQVPATTPDQLIQAVNAVRTARGLTALKVNSILMGTAQYTADVMAGSKAASQLGTIKDRIIAAGYGSGFSSDSIWGVEDLAVSQGNSSASQIISTDWVDGEHMIPMTNPSYCDVGAGVSQSGDGSYYYVLHAAYNSNTPCGKPASGGSLSSPSLTATATASAPQWIVPITRSTPDEQGRIYHIVRQGQTLWYIAISYGTKINAIMALNNMGEDNKTLYNGERLLIPTSLTPLPTITPTPSETAILADTPIAQPTPNKISGTPPPAVSPTPDPTDQAAVDERFRGGLFIALVISIVLIVVGLLVSRR
jgi:hypothetical protein